MKRLLAALIAGLVFAAPAHALDIELSGSVQTSTANVNDTSNATFDVVALASNKTVKAQSLILSVGTDGPDTLTVKCGSTTKIGPIYFGANSGVAYQFYPERLKCASGEALKVTKGTAGTDVTAFVTYTQE